MLRALPMAGQGALAFTNLYRRMPVAAGVNDLHYPTREEVEHALHEAGVTAIFVPELLPPSPGGQAGDSRVNILMLGVFAGYTNLLPRPLLEQAIEQRLPRFAVENARTFVAGWNYGASLHAPY